MGKNEIIEIYTDGAYSPLRNQGGWAFVVLLNGDKVSSYFGGEKNTTNNRMEIQSVIESIKHMVIQCMLLEL
jgi:ribonuclease HI